MGAMKKNLSIVFGLLTILAAVMIYENLAGAVEELAPPPADTAMVAIKDLDKAKPEMPPLKISKGMIVIWANVGKKPINIVFENPQQCELATDTRCGFAMDPLHFKGYSLVPAGGTASLRFKDAGTFDYAIRWEAEDFQMKGKIIVQ